MVLYMKHELRAINNTQVRVSLESHRMGNLGFF